MLSTFAENASNSENSSLSDLIKTETASKGGFFMLEASDSDFENPRF